MEKYKVKNKYILIATCFCALFLSAFCDHVRGFFIPLFKQDFGVNNTSIGMLLLMSTMGYILFTYIGGYLCEKFGSRKVFSLGLIFIIISMMILKLAPNYPVVIFGLFVNNAGLSLVSITINTMIPNMKIKHKSILMNLVHFCYAVGASITQRMTGVLLEDGYLWRNIYLGIGIIVLFFLIITIKVHIPSVEHDKVNQEESNKNLDKTLLTFYMLALGFYLTSEVSVLNWFVNYMKEVYTLSPKESSFYMATFFMIFAIGRFTGGFISEKVGYLKITIVSLFIAFIVFLSGMLMAKPGLLIMALSGIFFSVGFPNTVLTVSENFKQKPAYYTGLIITAAFIGQTIMNFIIGFLNDKIGVYKTFYLIPLSLFLSTLFLIFISIRIKKNKA